MSLITLTDPQSPISEAYRTLRTNLSFYSLDKPLQTLVVTSPAVSEDNGVSVANLAVTMAQSGRNILLIDCDLRRPVLHEFFGLSNENGLTTMILDDVEKPPLQQTNVENLSLLASGPKPPNPADMLGSKKVDQLIASMTEQFDFVLFNAPPVVAVTDATILGAKVDGVLLVITAGKTRRDHAEKAKEMLEQAHVRVVGVALTNAPKDSSLGDYYN
ncbi:MAG: CpsD/CapB family tyrosine-protein kinase [Anaerolineae bacterium]|nr:CpsD/CapB family tyrosine-protein kinase [Anaerolineae bacterium]